MSCHIYCQKCIENRPQHMDPEDQANGWQERRVTRPVKKPPEHFIAVNGVRHDLATLKCDCCGEVIPDGTTATMLTFWRGPEPPEWEQEYAL